MNENTDVVELGQIALDLETATLREILTHCEENFTILFERVNDIVYQLVELKQAIDRTNDRIDYVEGNASCCGGGSGGVNGTFASSNDYTTAYTQYIGPHSTIHASLPECCEREE